MKVDGDGAMGSGGLAARLDAVAAACRTILDPSARVRIAGFLDACRCADGGYRGRADAFLARGRAEGDDRLKAELHAPPGFVRSSASTRSSPCPAGAPADLYYTQFGLAAGLALGLPPDPAAATYVAGFGDGEDLDFVHLASLLRCQGIGMGEGSAFAATDRIQARLGRFRAADGGYARTPHAAAGTPYDAFLAAMAGAEVAMAPANFARVAVDLPTPVLAATLSLAATSGPVCEGLVAALAGRRMPGGGFLAVPGRAVADLLSTAVALFALLQFGGGEAAARTSHLAFVASLWNDDGGFSATADDAASDCEYTFYALLALGALAS